MEGSNPANATREAERADEKSIAELVRQLSEQTQSLASKEMELAKAEVAAKGKRLGIGAGAFGAAGLTGAFAFGAFTAALILVLATAMESWVAALIVTVAYAAVAGVLALMGRKQVEAGSPPIPEQAIDSTRQDLETAKQSAKEGRR
jgi:Putative Actinobacterial Holin-X, holin superfamily III